jgi:hypothetical protein
MHLFRNLSAGAAALAAAFVFQAAASAQSSTLISQGKTVTSTSFYDQGTETFPASNITDGRFDDTGSPSNWSFWLTPNGQMGSATIDLGGLYTIDQFQLQNTHNRGYNDRGTDAFDISVSTDGVNFAPVVTDSFGTWPNIPIVTENLTAPIVGEYVKFNIDSIYGSSGGLNELQVYGSPAAVPEASTTVSLGLLLILGLGGMIVAKKRKKSLSF